MKILFSSLFIFVLFFRSFIFHLNQPVNPFGNEDTYASVFILNHWWETLSSGQFRNLSGLPMLYGFKNSLFFSDHLAVQGILSFPIYLTMKFLQPPFPFLTHNLPLTAYNLFLILTLYSSFLSMSFLAFRFTGKTLPSLLAGVIFIFNPWVMSHFPGFIMLLSLQWIPLIFLCAEIILKGNSHGEVIQRRRVFAALPILLTLQLLSSLYLFAILAVILPLYFLLRILVSRNKPGFALFVSPAAVTGLLLFLLISFADFHLYKSSLPSAPLAQISREQYSVYSAWPADFLIAPDNSLFYGNWNEFIRRKFPSFTHRGMDWERSLFPGFTVMLLIFFLLPLSRRITLFPRSPETNHYEPATDGKILIAFLILTLLLSMGPLIRLNRHFTLPGPFTLITLLTPVAPYLRVPARFAVMAYFFLGLTVSGGINGMSQRFPKSKIITAVTTVIIIFILFDFSQKPFIHASRPPETINFYAELQSEPRVKVIVDLPIGNRLPGFLPEARPEDLDAHYLYYALIFHRKKLLNGFASFMPAEYYERAAVLSVNFPTKEKIGQLISWGADAAVIHREEFTDPKMYREMLERFSELGFKPSGQTKNETLYLLF